LDNRNTVEKTFFHNAFFRIGYIEAWGRGIKKMDEQCLAAGLPKPLYYYESSGFWVEFRKDIYFPEYLKDLGLNERQIKAVLYVKEKGRITNAEYKEINNISRQMATNELHNLVHTFKLLKNNGYGAGSYFELVN
jgi:ATP-dependent DNA helicase RecG